MLPILLAAAATDEFSCSLNGQVEAGACVCDRGWRGERCQQLNLTAPDPDHPGYYNTSMPSWGGDAIQANGSWHLFVTVKSDNRSPFDNYMCNTAIARLEGESINGPFVFREIVLDRWHHEAHAVVAPDGKVLIFMLTYDDGTPSPAVPGVNSSMCAPNTTSRFPKCYPHGFDISHQVIAVSSAPSVYGPWSHDRLLFNEWPGPKAPRDGWNCQSNCPSVIFEPDGSVLMAIVGRQCFDMPSSKPKLGEKIGFLTAPHWTGPYSQLSPSPAFGFQVPEGWPISSPYHKGEMTNEDPFLWKGRRGYHILMHSMMSKPDTPQDYQTRGIHAFSKDGRTNWTINPDPMWETNVTWTNGSATHFYRRQAPTLYFNADGSPALLQTAVDHIEAPNKNVSHPEGGCWWGRGWTLLQPVGGGNLKAGRYAGRES